jgi:hypothetical protein
LHRPRSLAEAHTMETSGTGIVTGASEGFEEFKGFEESELLRSQEKQILQPARYVTRRAAIRPVVSGPSARRARARS